MDEVADDAVELEGFDIAYGGDIFREGIEDFYPTGDFSLGGFLLREMVFEQFEVGGAGCGVPLEDGVADCKRGMAERVRHDRTIKGGNQFVKVGDVACGVVELEGIFGCGELGAGEVADVRGKELRVARCEFWEGIICEGVFPVDKFGAFGGEIIAGFFANAPQGDVLAEVIPFDAEQHDEEAHLLLCFCWIECAEDEAALGALVGGEFIPMLGDGAMSFELRVAGCEGEHD